MSRVFDYSIIIPVFNNEGSIAKLLEILHNKIISSQINYSFELIIIDDGSTDKSFHEILKLKENYTTPITLIKFTRNFGQLSAILAGYQQAKGKYVFNISADLQDPPELMNQMIDFQVKENYEIVICTRIEREENAFRRYTSAIFYKLIKLLSFNDMPAGGFDYVLLSEKVKETILKSKEVNPFWQGQILWTGYKVKFIPYKRLKRTEGKSGWSFSKKIKYLIDGLLSYSYLPIRLMAILGLIVALIGFLYALFIIIIKIFGNVPFKGWAPIMVLVLVLSGIQMLMLGIIGEYLWRTLDQVRGRPHFIIEQVID